MRGIILLPCLELHPNRPACSEVTLQAEVRVIYYHNRYVKQTVGGIIIPCVAGFINSRWWYRWEKLRHRTAATNGPIVHPPGENIWAWRTMVEWYRQRKSLFVQQSHLAENQEELAREIMNLVLQSIFTHTSNGSLICCKILGHGSTALLLLRRAVSCRFILPLKIHYHRPGMNPRTLGTIASTLIITPQRMTKQSIRRTVLKWMDVGFSLTSCRKRWL
jgi:hypothetical protein